MRRIAVALWMLVAGWSPSLAAAPPAILLSGIMPLAVARSATAWCTVAQGTSTFLRNTTPANAPARISFPEITFTVFEADGSTYYSMAGQAQLYFTSATAGTINFVYPAAYPASVRLPAFTGYTQAYNASHVLGVSFVVQFPGCALTVSAIYRNL
jgi:hypothetical protein